MDYDICLLEAYVIDRAMISIYQERMEELERMRREELGLNSDDEFVEPELTEEGNMKE